MERQPDGATAAGMTMGHAPSQALRKIVIAVTIAAGVGFLFVADSWWTDGGFVHETIEWVGVLLLVTCILGRTWCALYIGGRKFRELVTEGPYSVSRNPLYLFSIIGALGIGAQFGSVSVAIICGAFTWLVFLWTAMREEAALRQQFGGSFSHYMEKVPRFMPKIALWSSPSTLTVQPRVIRNTFFDALVFLTAIPLMEFFEYLHGTGTLPVYFTLP